MKQTLSSLLCSLQSTLPNEVDYAFDALCRTSARESLLLEQAHAAERAAIVDLLFAYTPLQSLDSFDDSVSAVWAPSSPAPDSIPVALTRITQVLDIMRNWSFDVASIPALVESRCALPFLRRCLQADVHPLRHGAADTVVNICKVAPLRAISESTGWIVDGFLMDWLHESTDRIEVLAALALVAAIASNSGNKSFVEDELASGALERIAELLVASDTAIVIGALEALYQVSLVGDAAHRFGWKTLRTLEILCDFDYTLYESHVPSTPLSNASNSAEHDSDTFTTSAQWLRMQFEGNASRAYSHDTLFRSYQSASKAHTLSGATLGALVGRVFPGVHAARVRVCATEGSTDIDESTVYMGLAARKSTQDTNTTTTNNNSSSSGSSSEAAVPDAAVRSIRYTASLVLAAASAATARQEQTTTPTATAASSPPP